MSWDAEWAERERTPEWPFWLVVVAIAMAMQIVLWIVGID